MQILIQEVWGGAKAAFLTSFQVILRLMLHEALEIART